MKQSGPNFRFVSSPCDNSARTAFRTIPETTANWDGFFAVLACAVPVVCILRSLVEHTLGISQPENQRGLATSVGDIFLKIEHRLIHRFLQPFDRSFRMKRVHRRFKTRHDKRAVVDETE